MPQQTPHAASCTVGIGPRPWDIAGGGLMAANRAVWPEFLPLREVGQGPVGRNVCPSHHMGGCDCAQDGGGIGWHDQGQEEAQSLGRKGGWHQRKPACKGGVLFACPHTPSPSMPTPSLSGGQTEFCHSPLTLPQGCVLEKGRMQPEKGPPATAAPVPHKARGRG